MKPSKTDSALLSSVNKIANEEDKVMIANRPKRIEANFITD
jgi:hypothetical protein